MSDQVRIDTRFLTPKVAKKFDKKSRQVFEKAYLEVLESLADPKNLPYVPTLYIFPYLLIKVIPVSTREGVLLTESAMQSIDPSDTMKLAIFASVYMKRLPFKEIVCTLAHEIVHFIAKRGSVDVTLEDVRARLLGRGYLDVHKSQEQAARKAYDLFKEPLRSRLIRSDKGITARKYKKEVTAGAKFMKSDDFLEYILGDKYDNFEKEVIEKLKHTQKRGRV